LAQLLCTLMLKGRSSINPSWILCLYELWKTDVRMVNINVLFRDAQLDELLQNITELTIKFNYPPTEQTVAQLSNTVLLLWGKFCVISTMVAKCLLHSPHHRYWHIYTQMLLTAYCSLDNPN
jgi:hypothetical protein